MFREMEREKQEQQKFTAESKDELRIVLLGKTGVGKSSTGNTILGRDVFKAGISEESVTEESQRESSVINGRRITVIDTPGLFDTELSNKEIQREISNCISMILPGPHVFIIVLNLGQRYTEESETSAKIIQEMFGQNSLMFTMVLFTRGDDLKNRYPEECLGKPGSAVRKLIQTCGNRYHVFNNKQPEDRTQVSDLLEKIDNMVKMNGGRFYTLEMFREMEREKQEQQKRKTDPSFFTLPSPPQPFFWVQSPHTSCRTFPQPYMKETEFEEDDQLKTEMGDKGENTNQNVKSTETVACNPPRRRRRSKDNPLQMRIVLLGKSTSENSEVGNLILGRSAFDSKAPPDVVERVGGRLKDRHVTLINCPQLLRSNISDDQITQTVRECVSLSDPGPHVVVLLLQHQQCSAEDQERVEKLQDSFSERLLQHTLVLSTQEPTEPNQILQEIIQKCSNRHFSLQTSSSADLLQAFEDIEQSNEGRHLISAQYEAYKHFSVKQKATQRDCERLNVLVCGSDGSLKSSISELILQHTHRRSESVRTDVDLHGRPINVLELPALFNTGLSEEEVMRQTLRCVSRCHPGVHAFLLIIPDAPLNNEDRAEMEEIQKIFSSRINKHVMILIMQNSEHQTAELSEETQAVIQSFGGRQHYFSPKTQVSTLMENVEKMLEENRGGFYSTETFLEVQMKRIMEYEEMKKKLRSLETYFLSQGSAESDDELRIVLLGKTGVGKSSTGNTILGNDIFAAGASQESVTEESQRESCEINGRRITVIDTPGLFDTELSKEEIQREISNCISMILPGPHVFIIVLTIGQRFTKEEETSVKFIQETFGEHSLMFTMVLFTRGDDLEKRSIEVFLGKPGSVVRKLLETCGNRYHVFNNKKPEDRTQVSDLLKKIDNMVKANGGSFYSCKMFREMEREKQEQQMKILMNRVIEAEEEKDRMKMMMEEERQNQGKESSDEQIQRLKSEIEVIIKKKERAERERQEQLDDLERRLKEERNLREDQQKTVEDLKLKLFQQQYEAELKRRRAKSASIFAEIICQKLKEPIEQSVYKKTARDLADELRSNCESLNGNRTNLEKHILKTLAEEEDFDKYMNYIHYPKGHYKRFIRDEVSQYISDKFSISVLPKMKENIKLLQQKIMNAAHESTEHVQVNSGDVGLWMKSFTQQLSDQLIFSEKHLSGVKHDDVDDFRLLEDVIRQELTAVMLDISRRFNTDTFPVKLDYKFRPDELLIDHFCQCCWVQCPFCGVTCTNSIEDHRGDHSVAFHRVRGINGRNYTQSLCADICTDLVASGQSFSTPDGRFPWRDYRRAGGVYACWSITPGLSELPYWKWFVCRFQKDLEKAYNETFTGRSKIPDEWGKYSKREAIESLVKYV